MKSMNFISLGIDNAFNLFDCITCAVVISLVSLCSVTRGCRLGFGECAREFGPCERGSAAAVGSDSLWVDCLWLL